MKYVLDTADLQAIKHANEFYPIEGVTTNPSIIAKEKCDFKERILEIRKIIGEDKVLCVQTTSKVAEEIVCEARALSKLLGKNFYIKVPIGEAGLKACMELKKENIGVLMTAIFTPAQALLAAKAGAKLVAPYVNRLEMINGNGVGAVADMVEILDRYNLDCKVLAASFKNVQQIADVALAGFHYATVSLDVLSASAKHPMTDLAVEGFDKDWKSVYGDKKVIDLVK